MTIRADHHAHIFSPAAVARIERFGREFAPATATQLVRLLDEDGVGRALVLSAAYFFGMPDAGDPDAGAMAAENDWTAEQVAQYSDRLAVCCSVNPLLPGAALEIERCASTGRFVGLKLHLANSDVDLRDPDHLRRLGEVFERANAARLMIAIHMRTRRPDYGGTDARALIDQVLPKAPDVAVQIAHGAGWGGYDPATDQALAAFATWAAGNQAAAGRVHFDLALSPLDDQPDPPAEDAPDDGGSAAAWREHRFDSLAADLRAIGLDRVLFATDWPVTTPRAYLGALERRLPLQPAEFDQLRNNIAPWLAARNDPH
jgi:predicted TIM-barrel fold metal-dependent hydrolase